MTTSTQADYWGAHETQFWLRGEQPAEPVSYDDTTGIWNVYGHQECLEVLTDPGVYSSDISRILPPEIVEQQKELTEGSLLNLDPPLHNKMRKLVSRAFTPKVVADLEPRIAAITRELLDATAGRDRLELVADLAYPLPVIVIAELLGVPASDRDLFKSWVDGLLENSEAFSLKDDGEAQGKRIAVAVDKVRNLTGYLAEHAEDRRRHPREDLLTKLVEAEVDGERLNANEVVNFANVLLIAGHITTTMLLGNTVLCLDAHPEEFRRTRADRSRIPAVIEESLRFLSPFAKVTRVTNREVELGGKTVPADQLLMVCLAAANRDARTFADPDRFDADREPNPQIAFGKGVHFCIGAPLARLEGRVALDILLDRFPTLRTDPELAPTFLANPNTTGVRQLPLLLS